jgi:hypothetical protein
MPVNLDHPETPFRVGPHLLEPLDAGDRAPETLRARLNGALLAQRPEQSAGNPPIEISPRGLAFVTRLASNPGVRIGAARIAIRAAGGWTPDVLFRRQEHAGWMRIVDGRLGGARRHADLALQDYWRCLCVALPGLGPDDPDIRVSGLDRRGQPEIRVDGVLAMASRGGLAEMLERAAAMGAVGALSVGGVKGKPVRRSDQTALGLVAVLPQGPATPRDSVASRDAEEAT